jgi:hypothetical protein
MQKQGYAVFLLVLSNKPGQSTGHFKLNAFLNFLGVGINKNNISRATFNTDLVTIWSIGDTFFMIDLH